MPDHTWSFWKGKRIFLTGHTGFKGSWLSAWLTYLGAEVYGYALQPPTQPALYEKLNLSADMKEDIRGDVCDAALLRNSLLAAAPEIIIHMAAQPLVRKSYSEPAETFHTNVMGTVHLLDAARGIPSVRTILIVTTDKCYQNHEWYWAYRENDALGGADPYSASKACAELVAQAYRSSYFASGPWVATARAGNVIGGGDWAQDRIVPDIVASIAAQRPVILRNPKAVRPWQHVLEPLYGYMLLCQALFEQGEPFASAWNFGPDPAGTCTVEALAAHLCEKMGGTYRTMGQTHQPHEAGLLRLDSSKAAQSLLWRPALSLEDTLDWTAQWVQAHLRGQDLRSFTLQQITDYMNRVKR